MYTTSTASQTQKVKVSTFYNLTEEIESLKINELFGQSRVESLENFNLDGSGGLLLLGSRASGDSLGLSELGGNSLKLGQ